MLVLPRATGDVRPPTLAECVELEQAAGFDFGAFHQQWQRQRAPESVHRYLQLGRRHPNLRMTRQGFGGFDSGDPATAAFAAINTSAFKGK